MILLVITIIVIIILAGTVILSLANNNPIGGSKDAIFRQNVANAKEQLAIANAMAQIPEKKSEEIDRYYDNVQRIIDDGNLPLILDRDTGTFQLDTTKVIDSNEATIIDEILGIIENAGIEGPEVDDGLSAMKSITVANPTATSMFFENTIPRQQINSVKFVKSNTPPVGIEGSISISEDEDESIIMWWTSAGYSDTLRI